MLKAESYTHPFNHWVIDGFFDEGTAVELAEDFYAYDDPKWLTKHSNALEDKQLATHWDSYPKSIYSAFFYLCSHEFIKQLEQVTGIQGLIADYGLHGGGMHIHRGSGGKLNLHKDAEMHPKLQLARRLNIVIYLNQHWETSWGGSLQLWEADEDGNPKELAKEIAPMFNRALIFDTTKDAWHGLPDKLEAPEGQDRKSIALFYYTDGGSAGINSRKRAMFAPTEDQKSDPNILELIKHRSM